MRKHVTFEPLKFVVCYYFAFFYVKNKEIGMSQNYEEVFWIKLANVPEYLWAPLDNIWDFVRIKMRHCMKLEIEVYDMTAEINQIKLQNTHPSIFED